MLAVLALAAVALVVKLDVEDVDAAVKPLEAGQLLRYLDAEVVGDLHVTSLDHDLGAGHLLGVLCCLLVWLLVCLLGWGGQDLA